MKKCGNGKKCKVSPGEPIAESNFERHPSGNLKSKCRRCYNTSVSKIDTHSTMQHFMTRTLWNKSSSAAINVYCSEPKMAL